LEGTWSKTINEGNERGGKGKRGKGGDDLPNLSQHCNNAFSRPLFLATGGSNWEIFPTAGRVEEKKRRRKESPFPSDKFQTIFLPFSPLGQSPRRKGKRRKYPGQKEEGEGEIEKKKKMCYGPGVFNVDLSSPITSTSLSEKRIHGKERYQRELNHLIRQYRKRKRNEKEKGETIRARRAWMRAVTPFSNFPVSRARSEGEGRKESGGRGKGEGKRGRNRVGWNNGIHCVAVYSIIIILLSLGAQRGNRL